MMKAIGLLMVAAVWSWLGVCWLVRMVWSTPTELIYTELIYKKEYERMKLALYMYIDLRLGCCTIYHGAAKSQSRNLLHAKFQVQPIVP